MFNNFQSCKNLLVLNAKFLFIVMTECQFYKNLYIFLVERLELPGLHSQSYLQTQKYVYVHTMIYQITSEILHTNKLYYQTNSLQTYFSVSH